MQAFILAGGFATRLWPLTERRAKPLLPLAGKPIINYLVETIPTTMPIAVSTNTAFAADFAAWKDQYGFNNVTIIEEHSVSDDKKLGALGALSQWITQQNIQDDILLLAGDNYFGAPLTSIIDVFNGQNPLVATCNIGSLEQAKSFGTVLTEGEQIIGFEEKPLQPKSTLISTGASIIPRAYLPVLQEYAAIKPDNIGGIFEELLAREVVIYNTTPSGDWFDIGSFWAYLEATNCLLHNQPQSADLDQIHHSRLEGATVIGEDVVVQDCILKNTVVFGNCVLTNCILEDCVIDTGCTLSNIDLTGKMIRAHSRLENTSFLLPTPII